MPTISRLRAGLGITALVAAGFLSAPLVAGAATAPASMSLVTTVTNSCSATATPVNFGTWSFTADSTASSSISVICTTGAIVASVGLDNGLNAIAGQRHLKNGSSTIAYGLFQDSGYATAWSNAAFPASTTYTASGAPSTFTVYAKAPAGGNVAAGSYSDTVGVTVTYT